MLRYIVRRVALGVVVFAGLIVLAFVLVQVLPGDPARSAAGRNATAAQIAHERIVLGLNQPLPVQFWRFLGRLGHGDLGTSIVSHRPVLTDIVNALPSSLELVVAAMVINILIGIPLGVTAAYRRGKAADIAARIVSLLGAALPVFWLGLLLQLVFSSKLGWLPLYGQLGFGASVRTITGVTTLDAALTGNWSALGSALIHLILPAVTLSAGFVAVVARTVRSSMITTLDSDYVMLARSTGASEFRIVVRHGLRNALIPVSTILGMQLGWMLGSTVLVESSFNRTGIGAYMVTAVLQNDLNAVIGSIIVIGLVFIVANLAVDIVQLWINPRLRSGMQRPRRAVTPAAALQEAAS